MVLLFTTEVVTVLVKNLLEPRPVYKLQDVDETFLFHLKVSIKENPVNFGMPLICVVRGLKKKTDFHLDKTDTYELEVTGENHKRLAMVKLCKEDPAKYSCFESILYAGIISVKVIPVIIGPEGVAWKFDNQNLQ